MFNTYGIRAINASTFNQIHGNPSIPRPTRDFVTTALRVHNLTLNILGYIPAASSVSGIVRMVTGLLIILTAVKVGKPKEANGPLDGPLYYEALKTGTAQIVRGFFEAVVPFGWIINATLDIVATPINVSEELEAFAHSDYVADGRPEVYTDPNYPHVFQILHFV